MIDNHNRLIAVYLDGLLIYASKTLLFSFGSQSLRNNSKKLSISRQPYEGIQGSSSHRERNKARIDFNEHVVSSFSSFYGLKISSCGQQRIKFTLK